nr:glycoprotein [Human metapneumovirus]
MGQVVMEVKVENIRAIDMLKARVKNRVARSKCFKNASLILIGITTLSIALNIYLIINYTIQKTTSESEHHTSSPPTESNKETSTIPIDNPDINPNSQHPTQQSTESLTLYPASSVSPSETEPASTPGITNRLSFVDRSTTQPSESRTKTNSTVHKKASQIQFLEHSPHHGQQRRRSPEPPPFAQAAQEKDQLQHQSSLTAAPQPKIMKKQVQRTHRHLQAQCKPSTPTL